MQLINLVVIVWNHFKTNLYFTFVCLNFPAPGEKFCWKIFLDEVNEQRTLLRTLKEEMDRTLNDISNFWPVILLLYINNYIDFNFSLRLLISKFMHEREKINCVVFFDWASLFFFFDSIFDWNNDVFSYRTTIFLL